MYKILSLDGGGSKGVYTIGVLEELEKKLGSKLCEHFDLVYGTSTGSIIASLIALGKPIEEIKTLYFDLMPDIMGRWFSSTRSECLAKHAIKIFEEKKFDAFKIDIGIVAMSESQEKPLIFKSDVKLAHGLKGSFEPGFGCKISEAVLASCAAFPFFEKVKLTISNQGEMCLIDGGFIANNPTLYALIDAHKAVAEKQENIRVLSIGVGRYQEKPVNLKTSIMNKFETGKLVSTILNTSSVTNEQLSKLLFKNTSIIRINESFLGKEYQTNMIEKNGTKLKSLYFLGRKSFAKMEQEIEKKFFN